VLPRARLDLDLLPDRRRVLRMLPEEERRIWIWSMIVPSSSRSRFFASAAVEVARGAEDEEERERAYQSVSRPARLPRLALRRRRHIPFREPCG
jgi:hypothetical protein